MNFSTLNAIIEKSDTLTIERIDYIAGSNHCSSKGEVYFSMLGKIELTCTWLNDRKIKTGAIAIIEPADYTVLNDKQITTYNKVLNIIEEFIEMDITKFTDNEINYL